MMLHSLSLPPLSLSHFFSLSPSLSLSLSLSLSYSLSLLLSLSFLQRCMTSCQHLQVRKYSYASPPSCPGLELNLSTLLVPHTHTHTHTHQSYSYSAIAAHHHTVCRMNLMYHSLRRTIDADGLILDSNHKSQQKNLSSSSEKL